MRYGICSVCQTKQSVLWMKGDYYLHAHDNPWSKKVCDGSGHIAEAVVGDSEVQRDVDEWDDLALQQPYNDIGF